MKCPECSELNEAGMQFCINCGHSLQAQSMPSAPAMSGSQPQLSPADEQIRSHQNSQVMVLICSACNKTDPLNGHFCVYCGARTYAGSISQVQASFPAPTTQHPSSSMQDVRVTGEEFRRAQSGPKKEAGSQLVTILLSAIAGISLGIFSVHYFKSDLEKGVLSSYWPDEAVLILSSAPKADVQIQDARQKSLVFGKTSELGSLELSNLAPGEFVLKLTASDGKEVKQNFIVNGGEQNVIGYPNRLNPI